MISVVTPTHNPRWLEETYQSLRRQTNEDWEWVVVPNGPALDGQLPIEPDSRIRVVEGPRAAGSVGAIKKFAFAQAAGDIVLELDHDDLLASTALSEVEEAMEGVDFVYSHCADFSPVGELVTYHDPQRRAAWATNGWKFDKSELDGVEHLHGVSWEPSAQSLSLIFYAPNHLRAWRRDFYNEIGGHDPERAICDDHDLIIRTYLKGRMRRIPKLLYLYRVSGANTWLHNVDEIRKASYRLREENLHAMVERECELLGMPAYDLGGAFGSPGGGWKRVDLDASADVQADLRERWPFEDSSVGAFRAVDLLEHLPDKLHTMSEIYRCLRPGGWLLSMTPSALGQGAFQDPTHCSYWVENSFRYYTEAHFARYIKNSTERFMPVRLFSTQGDIPYVVADLVSLKDDTGSFPGARMI